MTASLTPALALDFITALSADIRAGVVFDAAGNHLAGPPALAEAARALVAAAGEAGAVGGEVAVAGAEVAEVGGEAAVAGGEAAVAGGEAAVAGGEAAEVGGEAAVAGGEAAVAGGELEGSDSRGRVFVAGDERHLIVVVTGPFALARVARHDLRTALSALGGQNPPIGPPGRLDEGLVGALLDAV